MKPPIPFNVAPYVSFTMAGLLCGLICGFVGGRVTAPTPEPVKPGIGAQIVQCRILGFTQSRASYKAWPEGRRR